VRWSTLDFTGNQFNNLVRPSTIAYSSEITTSTEL